ncbi:MAG: hypothetical protein ACKN9V_07980 [Pseudomonadota bacterium]
MMKRLFLIILGLIFSLSPISADAVEIPTSEFFKTFQSEYQILVAGGQVPKEDNKFGSVLIEGGEGLFVFPYCHKTGGVCDPGFRSFPLESTRVYLDNQGENHAIYTLETLEDGNLRRYRWESRNLVIHFLDEQYTLPSGEAFPLEFIIEKAPS